VQNPCHWPEAIHASNMHEEGTARRISFQISTLRTRKNTLEEVEEKQYCRNTPKRTHTHTRIQAV